ncbi:hypothetical protein D3C80_1108380 [compost metagenome]
MQKYRFVQINVDFGRHCRQMHRIELAQYGRYLPILACLGYELAHTDKCAQRNHRQSGIDDVKRLMCVPEKFFCDTTVNRAHGAGRAESKYKSLIRLTDNRRKLLKET